MKIFQVYCPTTGTARPHEHADFDNFRGQEIRMTGMRLQLSDREKVVIVRNRWVEQVVGMTLDEIMS